MMGTIIDKKEVAKGTLSVIFKVEDDFNFVPGQFMKITLINAPYHDAEGDVRFFSIVNSPQDKGILQMATRLRPTAFKNSLKEFTIGTKVSIDYIGGNFILPKVITSPLVFIAGGIGITPYMSMLRYLQKTMPEIKITLIYSNPNKEGAAFFDEISALPTLMKNFRLIAVMTKDPNWQGETRHVDSEFIKDYFPDINANMYYVVGPPQMVQSSAEALKGAGVKSENIKTENFTGY